MNDSIIRTYYENLAAGRLVGKRCRACDCITFPPTALCEKCGKPDLDDVTLSGASRDQEHALGPESGQGRPRLRDHARAKHDPAGRG